MKKAILIVIVVGMLGWAVYEFVASSSETESAETKEDKTKSEIYSSDETESTKEDEDKSEGNQITSPPSEEKEAEVAKADEVGLDKGQLAPDFELTTLKGETVKLSDYRGERVMLNFWATWCPPCRVEMPDMQKFHENTDVVILAVNLHETESSTAEVQQFLDERDLTFPVLLDEQTVVATQYQIQPIPTSYMIDSNGRISNKAFGALNYEMMVQEYERME